MSVGRPREGRSDVGAARAARRTVRRRASARTPTDGAHESHRWERYGPHGTRRRPAELRTRRGRTADGAGARAPFRAGLAHPAGRGVWMRAQIRDGVWPLNSRIPTEHELSAILGVGRSAVREATRSLVQIGMLEAAAGQGDIRPGPQRPGRDQAATRPRSGRRRQSRAGRCSPRPSRNVTPTTRRCSRPSRPGKSRVPAGSPPSTPTATCDRPRAPPPRPTPAPGTAPSLIPPHPREQPHQVEAADRAGHHAHWQLCGGRTAAVPPGPRRAPAERPSGQTPSSPPPPCGSACGRAAGRRVRRRRSAPSSPSPTTRARPRARSRCAAAAVPRPAVDAHTVSDRRGAAARGHRLHHRPAGRSCGHRDPGGTRPARPALRLGRRRARGGQRRLRLLGAHDLRLRADGDRPAPHGARLVQPRPACPRAGRVAAR